MARSYSADDVLRWLQGGDRVVFWCPGCNSTHQVRVVGDGRPPPLWSWNGNMVQPTFQPSIKVTTPWSRDEQDEHDDICHSFVTDGRIQFLDDCTHKLAGQTVPLPVWPHARGEWGGIDE